MPLSRMMMKAIRESIPSVQSSIFGVRENSDVFFYNTSNWTLHNSYLALSVGSCQTTPPTGLQISSDGTFFVTEGLSAGAYSMSTGAQLWLNSTAGAANVSISPGDDYIAYSDGDYVYIVETTTWTPVATLTRLSSRNTDNVTAWSPDGTKIAYGNSNSTVRIANTSTWGSYSSEVELGGTGIFTLAFSPDSTLLAVVGDNLNNTLDVMNVATTLVSGSAYVNAMGGRGAAGLAFSSDGSLLFAGDQDTSRIYKFAVDPWSLLDTKLIPIDPLDIDIDVSDEIIGVGTLDGSVILSASTLAILTGPPATIERHCGVSFNKQIV